MTRSAARWMGGGAAAPPGAKRYTIGIYEGSSPVDLRPGRVANPVLVPEHVTDVDAKSVADPFMIRQHGLWHMFFEVVTTKGEKSIAHATSSDALRWQYDRVVLREPFVLSYPCVFDHENTLYMLPEAAESGSVRLYAAVEFPLRWELAAILVEKPLVDPSIVRYGDYWWLFAAAPTSDTLFLYYADRLHGPWTEHPQSPVVSGNPHGARPGGRLTLFDGTLLRFAQDDFPKYGQQVYAYRIEQMTTTVYADRLQAEGPVIQPSGTGWNGRKMHHLDPHERAPGEWIACVDGFGWPQ